MKALTKHERVAEILKCGKDPVHFINTYVKIQHPIRGRIQFETYPFQDDLIHQLNEHRFNIVLKSRQLGLSTVASAYAVWYAIFHKDKNILVIATKKDTAVNMIKKVKTAIKSLPPWLVLPSYEETQTSVRFSNGSEIKAIPTSPDAGRSEALSLLIIDEAAFIRDFEEIWTALSPTISTGGRALIISTPNGVGGMYYKLWADAEAQLNEFNPVRLYWDVHPEHDQAWFDKETRNLSKRMIAQEFLCDFIASGDTFLQPDDLDALKRENQNPLEKIGPQKNVWIWKPPVPGHEYVVSADVARGDGNDYSAFHIIDANECEVVGEYMAKIPAEKFADIIDEIGKLYNKALVCVENNTYGYFVNVKLRDSGYPRLYYESNRGDPFAYYKPLNADATPGFNTNAKTRIQILAKLEELIRNKNLKIYSSRLCTQLQSFIWNGSKPMAQRDSHDDLVISLAIGAWIVGASTGPGDQASAMAMAILKSTGVERRNQLPGGIDQVVPLVNPAIRAVNAQNVYRPRDPNEVKHVSVTDFSWLLR